MKCDWLRTVFIVNACKLRDYFQSFLFDWMEIKIEVQKRKHMEMEMGEERMLLNESRQTNQPTNK